MCLVFAPFAACFSFFKYHGMTARQFYGGSDQIRIAVSLETGVSVRRYLLLLHAGDHLAGEKNQRMGGNHKEREQKAEVKERKERKGRSDAFD